MRDAARAIALATEYYNQPEPVNIGSGHEISIAQLAEAICRLGRFEGQIRWMRFEPDGQPHAASIRRAPDLEYVLCHNLTVNHNLPLQF